MMPSQCYGAVTLLLQERSCYGDFIVISFTVEKACIADYMQILSASNLYLPSSPTLAVVHVSAESAKLQASVLE